MQNTITNLQIKLDESTKENENSQKIHNDKVNSLESIIKSNEVTIR